WGDGTRFSAPNSAELPYLLCRHPRLRLQSSQGYRELGRCPRRLNSQGVGMGEQKHPKGLGILFFTEMWERFSFYLMLGILYQYLSDSQKGGMALSDQEAAVIVGSYIALVYFTPFIGGLLADRLLGCRKTIVIGGLLMMMGHLTLAWPTALGLYLGLGLL